MLCALTHSACAITADVAAYEAVSAATWLAGDLRDESRVDRDERTNVQVARAWLAAEGRPSSAE